MIEPAPDSGRDLLLGAASGDPLAARSLLDLTGSTVYGFIFARVGGRVEVAQDLTQTTYLQALRSAASFRGDSALETWLCGIARHHVADYFDSERRRFRLERKLRLVAVEDVGEEDAAEEAFADGEALIGALGRMAPLYRQVLVLKYLDGLSVEEIAGELGRNRIQIQSLLQRARGALKRELEVGTDV